MAVFQEALHYALTLLRQGRLRIDELAQVMALYGARALPATGEVSTDTSAAALVDELLAELLSGGASAELVAASTTTAEIDTDLAQRRNATPDGFSLHEDSTDLGERQGFDAPRDRRIFKRAAVLPHGTMGDAAPTTRLTRFYTDLGIEPRVSPGLDRDGPAPDAPGTTQYALGSVLGRGGSGDVLLAVDRDLRRSVAIKALHETHRNNEILLRAFLEEAIITGGLEHPNIVPVYHLGYSERLGPYYVMKRLDGITLGTALQSLRNQDPEIEARFDIDRLLVIFIEICQGIIYAHDRQVIHCDLKPNNILIGHYGEVLIVDWGLAMVLGEHGAQQARAQLWSGTPGFMAPEQIAGDITLLDVRTDVWALGAILYSMLTLTRPFVGRTKHETLTAIMAGELTPPSERAPHRKISEGLERTCLRALARHADDRHASVAELLAEVEDHLAGRRRLRQRVELGQHALDTVRHLIDPLSGTEAVADALQVKLLHTPSTDSPRTARLRHDLQELRDSLITPYEEACRTGLGALEAGAHHPPLDAALADLYWAIFRRLYPARIPGSRDLQQRSTALLRSLSQACLPAIVLAGKRLASDDALATPDAAAAPTSHDPLIDAVLAYCGPDATHPDADDRDSVAARLGERLAFLSHVPIFKSLTGMDLLAVAEACERRRYPAQTAIFHEGDFGDSLYVLAEGIVNIVRSPGYVLNSIGPGGCIGEVAMVDTAPRTASAICATDVLAYRLSAERFRVLVADHGAVALGVMQIIAQRLRDATGREAALRRRQVPTSPG